jgi:hypothetical protein
MSRDMIVGAFGILAVYHPPRSCRTDLVLRF